MQLYRNASVNLGDTVPQNETNPNLKTVFKDIIHYPSMIQSTNSQKDPSYPYSNQSYVSNISNVNDSKTSDILEDSLVNDVFGCECSIDLPI